METTTIAVPTLQQHMLRTYLWLALGLFVSFVSAFVLNFSGISIYLAYQFPFLLFFLMLGQIGVVVFFMARLMKMSPITAKICYLLYALSFGVFLSYITMYYELSDIILALSGAGLLFVSLVTIGLTTKMDLTGLGTICVAGLISMIIYAIVGSIMGMTVYSAGYAFLGLIIFMGFTAYDAQNCVKMYEANKENHELLIKLSIYSAFEFYLDFINMFIRLLDIIRGK